MAELSIELWAVTEVDISGVARTAVSTSRDQAIAHFLQLAYLFAHAAPDQQFKVVGNDYDAALTGLHLIWASEAGPLCVASLTRPGSIGAEPGWAPRSRADASRCAEGGVSSGRLRKRERVQADIKSGLHR
jgi:hypothetical protein